MINMKNCNMDSDYTQKQQMRFNFDQCIYNSRSVMKFGSSMTILVGTGWSDSGRCGIQLPNYFAHVLWRMLQSSLPLSLIRSVP